MFFSFRWRGRYLLSPSGEQVAAPTRREKSRPQIGGGASAETMTAPQWAAVKEFQALFPQATIVVRVHKVTWKHDSQVGLPPAVGILVTQRVGPFTLRRELAAPIS